MGKSTPTFSIPTPTRNTRGYSEGKNSKPQGGQKRICFGLASFNKMGQKKGNERKKGTDEKKRKFKSQTTPNLEKKATHLWARDGGEVKYISEKGRNQILARPQTLLLRKGGGGEGRKKFYLQSLVKKLKETQN